MDARTFYRPAPGRIRSIAAFSQDSHYDELDRDCEGRCIRDVARAFSADGGLTIDNP